MRPSLDVALAVFLEELRDGEIETVCSHAQLGRITVKVRGEKKPIVICGLTDAEESRC